MNKQTRDRLRELAGKATAGPWVHDDHGEMKAVHSTIEMDSGDILPHMDWIIGYMQSSNCPRWKQDAEYIASISPDVLLHLLDKLDKADELADAAEEYSDHLHHTDCSFFKTRIQQNDCCDCGLNSLGLSLKAYHKAGESEGDDDQAE